MHDDGTSPRSEPHGGAVEARERAEAVKARVERDLLALPGVTGVDTGPKVVGGRPTDAWAIRVYVERKRDVAPAEALPGTLDGVPVDVIERRFVPHPGAAEPSDERRG